MACWDSPRVDHGGGEMDHGGEALIGLVGAHSDAFEFLEFTEEIFDQVPPLIDFAINPKFALERRVNNEFFAKGLFVYWTRMSSRSSSLKAVSWIGVGEANRAKR